MDLFGVVKLRYGVEVAGKYLVIRNIPWSSDDRVVSVAPAELNAGPYCKPIHRPASSSYRDCLQLPRMPTGAL